MEDHWQPQAVDNQQDPTATEDSVTGGAEASNQMVPVIDDQRLVVASPVSEELDMMLNAQEVEVQESGTKTPISLRALGCFFERTQEIYQQYHQSVHASKKTDSYVTVA